MKLDASEVRAVLVILSAMGMVYDRDAIRQKMLLVYPNAAIFFNNPNGTPCGVSSPQYVDVLIDLTAHSHKQSWWYVRNLRRMARFAVGRDVGLFRRKLYDRVVAQDKNQNKSSDWFESECRIQKQLFALAGISLDASGDTTYDLSRTIALELPPLSTDT